MEWFTDHSRDIENQGDIRSLDEFFNNGHANDAFGNNIGSLREFEEKYPGKTLVESDTGIHMVDK